MSETIKTAMDTLREALQNDDEYAWSWHCNIAMNAYDAGATREAANEGAARFMKACFGVDTRKNKYFEHTKRSA